MEAPPNLAGEAPPNLPRREALVCIATHDAASVQVFIEVVIVAVRDCIGSLPFFCLACDADDALQVDDAMLDILVCKQRIGRAEAGLLQFEIDVDHGGIIVFNGDRLSGEKNVILFF